MANKMLIDATHPEETRVVVVRGNRVEEFDYESASRKQLRGNIYLAKVTRVEPSLQAAFIEYGGNRHGFLAFSEIHPDYYQIPVADRLALLEEDERAARLAEDDSEVREKRRNRGRKGRSEQRDAAARDAEAHDDAEDQIPDAGENDVAEAGVVTEPVVPVAAETAMPEAQPVAEAVEASEAGSVSEDAATVEVSEAPEAAEPAQAEPVAEAAAEKPLEAAQPEAEPVATEAESGEEAEKPAADEPPAATFAAPADEVVSEPAPEAPSAGEPVSVEAAQAEVVVAEEPSSEELSTRNAPAEDAPAVAEAEPVAESEESSATPEDEDEVSSVASGDASDEDEADEGETSDEEASDSADEEKGRSRRNGRYRRYGKRRGKPAAAEASSHDHDDNHDDDEDDGDVEQIDEDDEIEHLGADDDALEEVPERSGRRARTYKIQEVIRRRQVMLVQVVKEERGNKGAALTTYLSLAGRYSVLMPNTARGGGISRKITNTADRKRLKEVVQDLEVPEGMGVILRTAGANRTKTEIKRDFEYLLRLWETVRELTLDSAAPSLVYEEGSLIKRAIRDLYNKDIDEVIVAGEDGYKEAKDFMRMLMPSHAKLVQPYRDPQPIYARYGVEQQLDAMFSPVVQLKSGGYIVIDPTEALVSIDVNSGRSTREHHIEDTALKTNLEAAEEIARQLRLRDLAGLIVVDFIDMEEKRNNRAVERKLKDCLKTDRARIQIGRISHFGLLEMSRQRIRTGVLESSIEVCPHCGGTGHVRSAASVALQLLRALEEQLLRSTTHNLTARVRTEVALYMLNQKRAHLRELEDRFSVNLIILADDEVTGHQPFVIEKGEPASRAPAVTRSAPVVQPDSIHLDDDFMEEEAVEEEAGQETETAEASEETEEENNRRNNNRRRRSRRRRRPEDGQDEAQSEAGEQEGESEASPAQAEGGEESESAEDDGEDNRGSDDESEESADRRRRRRGRRGGRRNRRDREGEGEGTSSEGASSEDSEADQAEADQVAGHNANADASSEVMAAEPVPVDTDATQETQKETSAAAQVPATESPVAASPVTEPAVEAAPAAVSAKPDETEEVVAKPRRRRRTAVREKAPAVGASEPVAETTPAAEADAAVATSPVEVEIPAAEVAQPVEAAEAAVEPAGAEAPVVAVETASTAEAPAEAEAPVRPRRTGWWQRKSQGE
ncbi:Rne/Rng family ribonuclease [Xanthobacter sp. TB0139]|uniref:Rne/Rng family ribonuclease n=1 Tax=Xanthobacter sp. TB0139 TaxID=3459178 RepID=UPI0040390E3D